MALNVHVQLLHFTYVAYQKAVNVYNRTHNGVSIYRQSCVYSVNMVGSTGMAFGQWHAVRLAAI